MLMREPWQSISIAWFCDGLHENKPVRVTSKTIHPFFWGDYAWA